MTRKKVKELNNLQNLIGKNSEISGKKLAELIGYDPGYNLAILLDRGYIEAQLEDEDVLYSESPKGMAAFEENRFGLERLEEMKLKTYWIPIVLSVIALIISILVSIFK